MLTVWAPDSSPDHGASTTFGGPLVTRAVTSKKPRSGQDTEGTTSLSNWVIKEAGADLQAWPLPHAAREPGSGRCG